MQHIVAARNDTLASAVDAAQQNIRTNRHILQGNTGEMVRRNTELKRFCAVQLMQGLHVGAHRVLHRAGVLADQLGGGLLGANHLADRHAGNDFLKVHTVDLGEQLRTRMTAGVQRKQDVLLVHAGERRKRLAGRQTLLVEQVAVGAVAVDDGRVREHFGQCFAAFKFVFDNLDCNAGIQQDAAFSAIPLQREFYNANLRYTKERTVVIISDAMRYEVGQELFARMQDDPKCTAKLSVQLSVLPSYTRLGMAALLPHKTLEMTDDFQVLADGILCDNLAGRQQVLQSYNPDSVCVQFDDIKNLKVAELRDVLTKRQIIYVYHNQIDARGDKANTEDEVFNACEEAVQEIMDLIHRISVSGNTYHFIVTADHGFIYKRDKLTESDKISGKSAEKAFVNRRFIVSKAALEDDGIDHMSMGLVLGNEDSKVVSYPVSSNVFKVAGGGANYVHGGSSPQEMLVPVLEFKMERGHMETKNAEIALVSIVHKITNLITSMDFIQSDAVSDTVKAAKYRIFFLSEDNEKISNENSYVADSREENAQKRIFRMRFTFKNKKYDKDKQYYLVVYDEESGLEQWRQPVIMDIAFADDFGFGF